jgi:ADP-heptose:LPS heptosyltransferase
VRVLALQLKRIGDLVLTTPALAALKAAWPTAHLTLAVDAGTASLLPAIPHIDAAIVFGRGRGWAPWQQVLSGRFGAVLDFTGSDRSALAAWLSRAPRRVGYAWTRAKGLRARAYHSQVESAVRDRHTITHYLDLIEGLGIEVAEPPLALHLPAATAASVPSGPYAVLHAGTARPEKNWPVERWAEVARHVAQEHGLEIVLTSGPAASEQAETHRLAARLAALPVRLEMPADLCVFARWLRDAALVISGDTSAVHLAAAFGTAQVALFGPTNPFHWRPRHARAVVLSAAQPEGPLATFNPRLAGAPMERLSTDVVCAAIDRLLASPAACPAASPAGLPGTTEP